MKLEKREVCGFTLVYDGIFYIKFPDGRAIKSELSLDTLMKIFNNEKINYESMPKPCYEYVTCNTTLVYGVFIGIDGELSYQTAEWSEGWQDQGITFITFEVKDN